MGWSSLAGAGISGISSLLGASQVSDGADKAAQAQAIAGQNATNLYTGAQQNASNLLSPYMPIGQQATAQLGWQLGDLTTSPDAPYNRYVDPSQTQVDPSKYAVSADPYKTSTSISQADLQNTPGYQFTLSQGLKAAQSSAAARGLGVSGAALKGAATYATGLSDQTYDTRFQQQMGANAQNFSQAATANQDNFGNALAGYGQNFTQKMGAANQNFGQDQTIYADQSANQTNNMNRLLAAAGLGQSAATTLTNSGNANAQGSANALLGVGQAQAAAANASGQAYGAALSGVGSAINNGIGSYNNYGLMSAGTTKTQNPDGSWTTTPNWSNANTFGNALSSYMSPAYSSAKGLFS